MLDQRATIIGMAGGFGQLFAQKLEADSWQVQGVDLAQNPGPWSQVEVGSSSEEVDDHLMQSGLVLLCVPAPAVLWWIDHLAKILPADSLCMDILSVKTQVTAHAARAQLAGEYLSLHPMFAPRVGFAERAVAAIKVQGGPRSDAMLQLIRSWGAKVHVLSAEDHDRTTAVLQAGVHAALLAWGQAANLSKVSRDLLDQLATPVSKPAFELLERMAGGDAGVYEAIQSENPYAQSVRTGMNETLARLDQGQAVEKLFEEIRKSRQ